MGQTIDSEFSTNRKKKIQKFWTRFSRNKIIVEFRSNFQRNLFQIQPDSRDMRLIPILQLIWTFFSVRLRSKKESVGDQKNATVFSHFSEIV